VNDFCGLRLESGAVSSISLYFPVPTSNGAVNARREFQSVLGICHEGLRRAASRREWPWTNFQLGRLRAKPGLSWCSLARHYPRFSSTASACGQAPLRFSSSSVTVAERVNRGAGFAHSRLDLAWVRFSVVVREAAVLNRVQGAGSGHAAGKAMARGQRRRCRLTGLRTRQDPA